MLKKILAVGLGMMIAAPAFAVVYDIDPSHTTFGFGVKHLLVSTTKGEFRSFSGTIEYDPADLSVFKADVLINVNSIDTRNTDRDKHLKSADFFDADNFPRITFNKGVLVKTETGGMAITGNLKIKDVSQKISIPVEVSGPVLDPKGKNVIGISGEVMINRQDFNVSFNKALDNGGLIVDNNVKLVIDIEAHERQPEPGSSEKAKAPAAKVVKETPVPAAPVVQQNVPAAPAAVVDAAPKPVKAVVSEKSAVSNVEVSKPVEIPVAAEVPVQLPADALTPAAADAPVTEQAVPAVEAPGAE